MSPKHPTSIEAAPLKAVMDNGDAVVSNKKDDSTKSKGVDQIRDILFGEQMQEYEQRINALERKLSAENKAMKDAMESRIADLLDTLEAERGNREEAMKLLSSQISDSSAEFYAATGLLRKSMDDQLENLQVDITSQVSKATSQTAGQAQKLAKLFRQMADELDE